VQRLTLHAAAALLTAIALVLPRLSVADAAIPEIRIFGSADAIIEEYKRAGYWGSGQAGAITDVPPYLTVLTSPTWDKDSAALPVEVKKELFYRSLLPLILYSNETILEDRARLKKVGNAPKDSEGKWLTALASTYGLLKEGEPLPSGEPLKRLKEALMVRVDALPASLALGQAAYESGYGTSRFARAGNALFGQWTYGGKGMQPKEKRASKGDYGVAAYDWPLDSVRGYMQNLNTHRAYEELRERRAAARAKGREATGAELAETLLSYSEKGAEYVKTLKGIMRKNELGAADEARLQRKPAIVIIDVPGDDEVVKMRAEITRLREAGELAKVLQDMGVDFD
jgi:uncharacterized FlgJ-related protein